MSRLAHASAVLLVFTLVLSGTSFLPVGVSYVVSDSMAPTIHQGDGFVRVPAGEVEPGEIIVFETPERARRYAVHRVVRETPRGFVTKGDNNEATDQAAGHPYVQREDVRGEVLTVAGKPLVIPNFGLVARFLRLHRTLLLTVLAGLYVLDLLTASTDRPSRPAQAGDFLDGMALVATVVLVLLLLLGGSAAQVTFVAVEGPAATQKTVPVGESETARVTIEGVERLPYTHYAIEWEGAEVVNRSWNGSTLQLTVRVPPVEGAGQYATSASIHRYPQSLPPGVVDRLYRIHPVVPAIATVVPLIAPIYVLGLLLVDREARLRESNGRWRSLRRRVQRLHRR